MIYQLTNNRVVEIPLRMYLEMDDEEFAREIEDLMAGAIGNEIDDIFYNSIITVEGYTIQEDISEIPLDSLPTEDKLQDLDVDLTMD